MIRSRALRALAGALLVACAPVSLAAQWPSMLPGFDFHARGPYRAAVPRPDSLLGHALGTRHTMYHQQQAVLDRMIAAAPERVRTEVIGRTHEGKVMRVLLISSPENIARLDAIRADLARLADPRATTAAEAAQIAERTPAVVLLTHSVHGNEPAGFEAAMQTAYQLLASDEPATLEILRHVVTIINPSQNPDGHERFAAWYNAVANGTDDPAGVEQNEPWPIQGRTNHYRNNLNRDLIAHSQPESQALAAVVQRWHPQVVVDLHSTTSQYFFPPAASPVNQNLPPSTVKWLERFGRGNGRAFDGFGWQYYVRDVFDLYYAGYWDSWPSLNGATGMTYESDGGPEFRLRKDDGHVMTFRDGIAHHWVASMATLATAAEHRVERLRDFHEFRAQWMRDVPRQPMKRVVLVPGTDPERAHQLARLLARQGVEVRRARDGFASVRAHAYVTGGAVAAGAARRSFPAGAYVVDLAQPQGRLAAAMLEPRSVLDSAFVRRQLDRYERNRVRGPDATREGYEFYDVTAWSLPLTFGVEAYWTEDTPAVAGDLVDAAAPLAAPAPPARAQSAYLFRNDRESSARLALHLLREGVRVGVATEPLRADGATHPAGTFVVRTQRNAESVHECVRALAARFGALVVPVQSAFADSGQSGVGGERVRPLFAPRVLLAAGDGIEHTAYGDAWFYLERELELPVTPVALAQLGRVRLSDYNVLVIPNGSGSRLRRELGDAGLRRLVAWVQEGGAVVASGDVVTLLNHKDVALTTAKLLAQEDGDGEKPAKPDSAKPDTTVSAGARPAPPLVSPRATGGTKPEYIPGAIFRAALDRTHWLTYGYAGDELAVFLDTDGLLKPSEKGDNPVAFVGKDFTLAGFTWPDNTERFLRNSAWAVVENAGEGRVVVFADNPLYRAFWRGTARLFTNALLMGPGR